MYCPVRSFKGDFCNRSFGKVYGWVCNLTRWGKCCNKSCSYEIQASENAQKVRGSLFLASILHHWKIKGLLQNFDFVAALIILNTLSCIFATSHVFIRKNALISTKMQTAILIIWRPSKFGTIPRAMYMDKENTLWKLSCVLLTRAKRAKCHAACKLSELCEFLHAACYINFARLPA